MTERIGVRSRVVLGALALFGFAALGAHAQTTQKPVTLQGGATYEDAYSNGCENQNENNPYTGMNPLACYGLMAPTDSRGQCSLGGMPVWKREGDTCYYCRAINPPLAGIIIPMDQVGAAEAQGFRCGADQADACMAVCSGGNTYSPPPATVMVGGGRGSPPNNAPADAGRYLTGVVDGFGGCVQGFGRGIGSLIAGAGLFAQGDFVDAAKAWGLSPGQSIVLKGMAAEMNSRVVGRNISPYQQGVTAGRRLCAYAALPGTVKAIGTAATGAFAPGSTFTNPIKGGALQNAIDNAPKALAEKWVQTPKGPVRLGAFAGQGSFASVFKYGKGSVIKFSKNDPKTLGYGPESIYGQNIGAGRVSAAGVETPKVSNYEPGGTRQPSTLVTDNVARKYPGSFQLSNREYHRLSPVQQGEILDAVDSAANKIAEHGYALLDVNPGNFSLQPLVGAMKAIIHDPDMVMTVDEIRNLAPNSVPRGVLNYALDVAGVSQDFLNQPFTAQSLTTVLNAARTRLITGVTNVQGSTVIPPAP